MPVAQGWSTSNFYRLASGIITAAPLSMFCWLKTPTTGNQRAILLSNSSSPDGQNFFRLGILSGASVVATCADGAAQTSAQTTVLIKPNVFTPIGGVFVSATDRRAYIGGGNKATNATSKTPSGINRTTIGCGDSSTNVSPLDPYASLAWPTIWNIDLTDGDMATLAEGCPPWLIRPANIVFCNAGDISGSLLLDRSRNRNHMTMQGTLQKFPDPPFVI